MNVCDYLLEGKTAASVALLDLHSQCTYSDLQSAALRVAATLVKLGGRKGDRAILISENGFFWVAAYLGIIRAGMACVPLSPKLPAEDLRYILNFTEPKVAFVQAKIIPKLPDLLDVAQLITDGPSSFAGNLCPLSLPDLQSAAVPESTTLPEVGLDDLAALMFTSGSTGKPRGVMVSNRNIIANTDSIIEYLSLTDRDRIMAVLPFHYCFGTSLLHTHLRVGASVVIDPRFMYPEAILQRMLETNCTGFAGVPSHFQILLRKSPLARKRMPSLRYVQQAGGQLAPTFIRELRNALPGTQIFIMYGQTEATARLSYLPPELLDSKVGSVGRGIPGVKLSVLDENRQLVEPGQIGEIVAEGDNIALGYWRDDQESQHCFRDGKLYTGDLATVDSDGFIYIVDRAKDFIKCGGRRVSCRQLENVLLENNALLEAAVIGVPDEVLGEAAVAYFVPRDLKTSPSCEELYRYCRERMPLALIPKRFVLLSSLPKNSSGKVLKTMLKHPASVTDCAQLTAHATSGLLPS